MKKKISAAAPAPVPNDTRTLPLHQEIATQAYVLWEHYGHPSDRDISIWLEAERQVLGVDSQVNKQAGGAVEAQNLGSALAADLVENQLLPLPAHEPRRPRHR
jgi:hypothetical protein